MCRLSIKYTNYYWSSRENNNNNAYNVNLANGSVNNNNKNNNYNVVPFLTFLIYTITKLNINLDTQWNT